MKTASAVLDSPPARRSVPDPAGIISSPRTSGEKRLNKKQLACDVLSTRDIVDKGYKSHDEI